MVTMRRAGERQHERRRKQQRWLMVGRDAEPAPLFGVIDIFSEHLLSPCASVGHPHRDAEVVTYVREGALAFEDSTGRSGIIRAGEFQRLTAGGGLRHRETNPSPTEWAHVFQVWLRPTKVEVEAGREQKRFSTAERHGALCTIASPDGRNGSLRLQQDALIFSAMLDSGQHTIHELSEGRSAWLQVVVGALTLGDLVLIAGDGARITGERAVSFTAREATEVLLLDLGPPQPSSLGDDNRQFQCAN
jgi:hypothetical protein